LKVSIVIPCYNEEESITRVLEKVELVSLPLEREVIVVDDGSTDNSVEAVSRFKFVKLVRHEVNRGKGAAIKTGVEYASGDMVVIQDADLEYDPESIPDLIKPLIEGEADMVLGSRFRRRVIGMSISHYIGNKALSLAGSVLLGVHITDIMTEHKAFTKAAYGKIDLASSGFEVEAELVAKFASMGMRIVEIPIPYRKRPFGQAKINWKHGPLSLHTILKHGRTENFYAFLVFASCFLYYMVFNLHNSFTRGVWLLTGDEPHYIIVAKSIIEDMDVKLANNYVNDPIWSGLDWHTVQGVDGYYSSHGIGLPLLLTPFYYFGGVFLSQVFLSFLSALLVMYIYKTCLKVVSDTRTSLLVSSIFGFASLIVPYSNQIFPEIPMALILILSTYYICLKQVKNPKLLLILGALIGYSPFLKTAYAVFIVPFTIYIVGTSRNSRVKRSEAYLIPIAVLGLALMAYQEVAFGNPLRTPQTFEAGNVLNGLFGLIFDRYFGLFTYSPVLALSIFGISRFYCKSKGAFAVASTSFSALYLTSSLWVAWQGGWSHPARLIIPVVPLGALPLAFSVSRYHRRAWFRLLLSLSTALSLLINFSIAWDRGLGWDATPPKQKIFNDLFAWVMKNFTVDLSPLFPDFNQPLPYPSWLWIASILVLLLVIVDWSRVN